MTLLSNPLNTTVLTSQLLSAPAIWYRPDGIRTSLRILSIFNTASIRILEQQGAAPFSGGYRAGRDISKEDWVKAVVKGADDRSPRWRHVLVLGGLLSGFESENREGLPTALRRTLEGAIVKAANLALEESGPNRGLDTSSLAMVLSYIFDLLSAVERAQIKYDLLLPVLCEACFFSKDGLHWGYFLGTMDADVVQSEGSRFNWSTRSSTYFQLQRISSGSLVASLGSLSRLTAFSIEMVRSVDLLAVFIDDLSAFTRSLCVQWRQNKLSEIDATDETAFLSEEALRTSLPLLWQVLKTTTFTIIICLRALLGRVLGDRSMSADLGMFFAEGQSNQIHADIVKPLSWQSKRSTFYEIFTLSPPAWDRTHLPSTFSSTLQPSISYITIPSRPKPSFARFGQLNSGEYLRTLWIDVTISTSSTSRSTSRWCFHRRRMKIC